MNEHENDCVVLPTLYSDTFDVSNGTFRPAISFGTFRSLIIDFMDDAHGNPAQGTLAVYASRNTGGLPWATVKAGSLLCRPIGGDSIGIEITVVPSAGATGLAHVDFSRELLPAGRF